jgi:iron complex outermembrane recepter protein
MSPHDSVSATGYGGISHVGWERSGRRKPGGGAVLALPAATTLLLWAAQVVVAQEAETPGNSLQEVVVTAQKRTENAQDVGIAVAAYSAADLQAAGITNVTDLARFTPGLGLSGSFAGQNTSISIRGVTQQDFNAISEGPNAVYIDEGYIGINNISAVGLFDIDRVEVLKGPQGTLFGRNATGGVVNILSNDPASTVGGYAQYTYGSYNTNRFEAALTGPLGSDAVTGRLAVLYDHNGAYVTNLAPTGGDLGGTTDWGLRGKIDLKAAAGLDILLTGFITRWTSSWGPYFSLPEQPVYAGTGALTRQVNSVPVANSLLWPTNTSDPNSLTLDAHDAQNHGDFQNMEGGSIRASYDAAGWAFTSVSDYKHFKSRLSLDDTALPLSLFDSEDNSGFQSFSQELRAYRDFHFLRLTSGLYYLHMRVNMEPSDQIFQPALGGPAYYQGFATLNTNAYAGFSQAEWDFAPQWTLIAGLRYTDDEKRYHYVQDLCTSFAPCGNVFYPAQDLSRSDALTTGKAEIEYHLQEGLLLYASYNRGAKSGGFNFPLSSTSPATQPPATLPYKPEHLTAYEAGFKSDWLSHTLQVNGESFYYDYRDFQSFILLPPLTTFLRNNPAITKGGELSINARPFTGLTTSLSVDYVHNRVSQVNIATLSGIPFYYTKEAPFTSPWQATALVRYEWPLFGGAVGVQADAKFTGTYYFSLTNYTSTEQQQFTLYDAEVSWLGKGGHWNVSVSGSNLTDVRYKTVGFDIAALFGEEQVAYGQPRWFRARVGYQF